ncbi:unnamed protein product [Schistosoma mattheei]|uniref:Uncharacterized protein n=1 Tax=Schistosoma mattheei TaxID=31246 RepID=A0A183NYA0_9TREM|nr:unnamed protein product [Schistosoma mattheei]
MFFTCKYAALALPIRACTSASDPLCSSMMLPKYVKVFTSSKSSPSIVIELMHSVLYRRRARSSAKSRSLHPRCPLYPVLPFRCRRLHDPVDHQEKEKG